mgnify:CR=1 FL=1
MILCVRRHFNCFFPLRHITFVGINNKKKKRKKNLFEQSNVTYSITENTLTQTFVPTFVIIPKYESVGMMKYFLVCMFSV